jgi:hypothetical protein
LRRLSGHALRAEHHGILRLLSTLPSSALAQAIPADVAGQFRWLTLLGAWVRRSRLRCDPPDTRFAWAAVGLGRALSSEVSEGEVDDICDLVRTLAAFNPRWTWPQAVAAPERRRPAAVAERRVPEAGVPAVPAPRASPPRLESPAAPPLPLRCFHFHAHDFIALQHAEDIREEGAQMHNCVHSYLEHVAAGRSVLFSLRREGGRAATLELVNVSDASRRRYIVGQLFGPCNAPPPDKAVTATAAFVAHLDAELAREQAARDEGYRLAAARGRLISLCLVRVMAEVPGGRLL